MRKTSPIPEKLLFWRGSQRLSMAASCCVVKSMLLPSFLNVYSILLSPLTGLNLTPHSLITKYPAFGSTVCAGWLLLVASCVVPLFRLVVWLVTLAGLLV